MGLIRKYEKKLLCTIGSEEDIDDLLLELESDIIEGADRLDITINFQVYNEHVIKQIEDLLKYIPKNLSTSFIVRDKDSTLKCSDLENFIDLEEFLNKQNVGLYFDAGLDWYELNDVIGAQEQIEVFTDYLKSLDASPFEKYLIIYDFLTNRVYKEEKTMSAKSRDVVSVLNGDNIVCVGYAKMLERLCNEVGIDCYQQGSVVYSREDGEFLGGHANNLIRMKDEKYGIDGLFYVDACWDSVGRGKEHKKTYSYCLLPLEDKDKIKERNVEVDSGLRLFYNDDFESVLCVFGSYQLKNFGINTISGGRADNVFFEEDIKVKNSVDYTDENRRVLACDRLEKIFKEYNIPKDVYSGNKEKRVPKICSFSRMLALCMEDQIDEKRMQEALIVLKKFIDNKYEFDFYKEDISSSYEEKKDVYKEIEKLKSVKTETEYVDYSWKKGYTFDDIIKAKGDNEALERMGFKKVVKKIDPKTPYEWRDVEIEGKEILKERIVKKQIEEFVGKSEAVSIEKFISALKRSYELRGMSQERISYELSRALEDTMAKSEKVFSNDASNCFSKQALIKREQENA